jgi:flagellin
MSRINTNPSSLIAQRNLSANNRTLGTTLERLSTGLRINRGKDDPAGLIASENLRAERSSLTAALSNAERADQIVNIAEGGLQEVGSLLTELRGLVTATANSAGLSAEEKQANQLQIDSILQTIDRVSDSTNFQGNKLLNGNYDFTTSSVNTGVADFRINGAKLNAGQKLGVTATVTASAQRGAIRLNLASGASAITTAATSGLFTVEVSGSKGSREFSFAGGTRTSAVAAAINSFKDVLGVSATTSSTRSLQVRSTEFGADQFVGFRVVNLAGVAGAQVQQGTATNEAAFSTNTALTSTTNVRDVGRDIAGTINGVLATGKGKVLRANTDFLDVELTLSNTAAQPGTPGTINALTITGGGADFQLSSQVNIGGKTSLGIGNISTRKIGRIESGGSTFNLSDLASGRSLNVVSGNLSDAAKAVDEALKQVSSTRGRLGAFQKNTIGATIRSLNVSLENTSAAESVIRDADFATETASLTRGQILAQAASNSLSLANSQPQQALSLLRG